jgi:hypothetical protein
MKDHWESRSPNYQKGTGPGKDTVSVGRIERNQTGCRLLCSRLVSPLAHPLEMTGDLLLQIAVSMVTALATLLLSQYLHRRKPEEAPAHADAAAAAAVSSAPVETARGMAPPPDAQGFIEGHLEIGPGEEQRLRVLQGLHILDTAAEAAFDNIVAWAKRQFDVPIALVSLVDANRQWFKSCYGLDVDQTHRDAAFCTHAILPSAPDIFEVTDATRDVRFSNNPLVTGPPNIRYYAGAPLLMGEHKLGTLCVIDTVRRQPMSDDQREAIKNLAAMVSDQLTSRLQAKKLHIAYDQL